MAMQTVIMAGGEGIRLRPLTQSMPKPLAPLCGEPVMGYALKLLQRHGIHEATATLWFRPEDVMREFGMSRHGVLLRYCTEDTPLGTAGSVRRAVGHTQDTTLVLSGDGLTGCDLTRAYAFHRARGAAATLVLTQVDIPLSYGVVVTGEDGRIERFVEKPDWSRVVGSLVNTGIYFLEPEVLELIPQNEPYDFGRQLFPRLLQLGLPLYGYVSHEYWCDVGNPAAFLRAQGDLLTGRAGFAAADMGIRKLPGGYISFDSYVDPRAHVAPDAVIRGSCVLAGAHVESGVHMTGSILCAGAQAGCGSVLTEGSILGNGARLHDFSRCEGGRLWAGVHTLPGTVVRTVIRREQTTLCVRDGMAFAQDPAQITHLAGAFLQAQKAESLILMHDGSALAAYALWLGALASFGVRNITDAGYGTAGMLSYAIEKKRADGGVLVTEKGAVLLEKQGLRLSDAACAQVQSLWQQLETPAVYARTHAICRDNSLRRAYLNDLAGRFGCNEGVNVHVKSDSACMQALAEAALQLCGHKTVADSDLQLQICGQKCIMKYRSTAVSPQHAWLLCAQALQLEGVQAYDVAGFGAAAGDFLSCDESETCREQRRLLQDDLSQMLLMLKLFAAEKPADVLRTLPAITQKMMEIPCDTRDKSRVLAALLRYAAPCAQGGLERLQPHARAYIRPDPVLPLLRVTAYAQNAENAQELCDFFSSRVQRALMMKGKISKSRMQ